MNNTFLLCAGLLAQIAAFAAGDASAIKPFYMINNTDRYLSINLILSGNKELKDLILTSRSNIQIPRNKEENSMEISGAILQNDAKTEVPGSQFEFINELVDPRLEGVIFALNEDCKGSPAASPSTTIPTSSLLTLILSTLERDDALKLGKQ